MPQPYNYDIGVPDPVHSMVQSATAFAPLGMLDVQQQRVGMEQAAVKKQEEEQKFMSARMQALQGDLAAVAADPSPKAFRELAAKHPYWLDGIKKYQDMFDPEMQRQRGQQAMNIYTPILRGQPEQAANIAYDYADAAQNKGDSEQAKAFRMMGNAIQYGGPQIEIGLAGHLMAFLGPDQYEKMFSKMYEDAQKKALMKPALEKATAEASKAGTEAKYAETKAQADLAHTQAQTASLGAQAEIAKETNRINAMKVQAEKATDALKKKELSLKIAEAEQKRDDAARAKRADFQEGQARIDNMVNTLDKIGQVGGWTLWRATGPVADLAPTILGSTSDFEELVNLANSQAFVNQVPLLRGFGALTEREGDKLQRSLQNLSLRQSGEQFMESVKESTRLLLKARAFLAEKYGIPSSIPDTPAVYPTQEEIDAASKKYGVK